MKCNVICLQCHQPYLLRQHFSKAQWKKKVRINQHWVIQSCFVCERLASMKKNLQREVHSGSVDKMDGKMICTDGQTIQLDTDQLADMFMNSAVNQLNQDDLDDFKRRLGCCCPTPADSLRYSQLLRTLEQSLPPKELKKYEKLVQSMKTNQAKDKQGFYIPAHFGRWYESSELCFGGTQLAVSPSTPAPTEVEVKILARIKKLETDILSGRKQEKCASKREKLAKSKLPQGTRVRMLHQKTKQKKKKRGKMKGTIGDSCYSTGHETRKSAYKYDVHFDFGRTFRLPRSSLQVLCMVCDADSTKMCACKKVFYCSSDCQVWDGLRAGA